jgi:hypothetical protein
MRVLRHRRLTEEEKKLRRFFQGKKWSKKELKRLVALGLSPTTKNTEEST